MNHQHLVDGDPGGGRDSCRSRGGSRLLAAVDLRFILVRRRLDLVSRFVPVNELLHQCLNVGFQGENQNLLTLVSLSNLIFLQFRTLGKAKSRFSTVSKSAFVFWARAIDCCTEMLELDRNKGQVDGQCCQEHESK